jgi:hypothetical protein
MTLSNEMLRILVAESKNDRIRGLIQQDESKWYFDRRYTDGGIWQEGLNPRNADFDIIGPAIVELSRVEAELIQRLTQDEADFLWDDAQIVTFPDDNPYNGA